jgi:hypothetical protein
MGESKLLNPTPELPDTSIIEVDLPVRIRKSFQDLGKTSVARFIDRFSRFYAPGVVAMAALVMVVPRCYSAETGAGGSIKVWPFS